MAGYVSYQPTTYYVQQYGGPANPASTHFVRVGTQVYHNDHWNDPTWHSPGITFTME